MSDIDIKCRKAILAATQELRSTYDFSAESPEETTGLYASIEAVIAKHILPVVQNTITVSPKSKSKGKPKVEKKSSRANHYAFFHFCCSTKGAGHVYTLAGYEFKYQPDLSTLKKGRDIYDELHKSENKDQLERFKTFNSKGDIRKVVEFVEFEFKNIAQMTRTAVIWNQFMSSDDHNKLKAWYAEITKDGAQVPEKHVTEVSAPIIKIAAKIRNPKFSGEESPVHETETDESPVLSTNNESDNEVYDALTETEQEPEIAMPELHNITEPIQNVEPAQVLAFATPVATPQAKFKVAPKLSAK